MEKDLVEGIKLVAKALNKHEAQITQNQTFLKGLLKPMFA
jgi:hypothetical protein